ncbi:MAG: histidine phosphatase family protein [Acidimicrobiales bacterium]|nr:histidine phosphatase family protein [Acidimicrobiales bacterium]MCB1251012.1 histidine phosphatase family protein [Acidimicrobiales bacterium]MCB1262709.1 histidine phosphatase family protein [Acidimicrobiales bacterium]
MTTRLLLVRHGESEWNASGRWQGQADPPLTDTGKLQAGRAAERVGAVDVIVSSDLERAQHTAVIISELIGVGPVIVDERFRERDAGPWSGLTRPEIEQGWPGFLESGDRPEGFETDDALWTRVSSGLGAVEAAWRGGTVLVVTHGGVVYTIERMHGITTHERLPNLGAIEVVHHGDRLTLGERLALGEA